MAMLMVLNAPPQTPHQMKPNGLIAASPGLASLSSCQSTVVKFFDRPGQRESAISSLALNLNHFADLHGTGWSKHEGVVVR